MNRTKRRVSSEIARLREATEDLLSIQWTPKDPDILTYLTEGIPGSNQFGYWKSKVLPRLRGKLIQVGLLPSTYRDWKDGCFSNWKPGEALKFSLHKDDVNNLRSIAKERGITIQTLLNRTVGVG